MRNLPIFLLLSVLVTAAPAQAQEACGQLRILNIVHMVPTLSGSTELVPVVIAGKPHNFVLDTGGLLSQISRPLVKELGLTVRQEGREREEIYDALGNVSRDQTRVPDFKLGAVESRDVALMIAPSLGTEATHGIDGLLGPDLLVRYDMELDFASDTMNLFSPDHCPGHVVYWNAPAVATVPITLEQSRSNPDHRDRSPLREVAVKPSELGRRELDGFHIYVQVMLDGHGIKALVDTGATGSALSTDMAEKLFGLTMGTGETPVQGNLNGDASVKTYSHRFKSLSFGTVSISDPRLVIIPNAMNRNIIPQPLVADRTKTERDLISQPDMILGMDILRRLRLYFAFQEEKMYVSPSSRPSGEPAPFTQAFIGAMLKRLDTLLAESPDDAATLNDRCFWRGIAKSELEGALADCDKSLALEPGRPQTLDSRAFVLFQQGKYQDALAAYEVALRADPRQAPSLWMRGLTRQKLGDVQGGAADIAQAKVDDPNVEAEFRRIGVED